MREEKGTLFFACNQTVYDGKIVAVRDNHITSRIICNTGSINFRPHTSGSEISGSTLGKSIDAVIDRTYTANELSILILAGIIRIQSVDIGKKNQEICADNGGNNSRKCIIISKFNLGSGNRIIFVDNRNNAKTQQFIDCFGCSQSAASRSINRFLSDGVIEKVSYGVYRKMTCELP